jgi:energy-coupling factor transport system substrate-specific component
MSDPFSLLRKSLSTIILALATLIGIWTFAYPFFFPQPQGHFGITAHSNDVPLKFLALLVLCLVVIIANLETRQMNSKMVAVLGILTAINSVLRLVPGPAGFSAIFFLPILCGYTYGADFGFLLGALSLLVSAVVTGGLGPWLPYQMFSAGWMGMASAWLPDLRRWGRGEVVLLAAWGALLGLIFGAIMNIWFWPYVLGAGQEMYWQPGLRVWETLGRYAVFYVVTSLPWDVGRAVGNFLLVLLLGAPVLRMLRRFQQRFYFVANDFSVRP